MVPSVRDVLCWDVFLRISQNVFMRTCNNSLSHLGFIESLNLSKSVKSTKASLSYDRGRRHLQWPNIYFASHLHIRHGSESFLCQQLEHFLARKPLDILAWLSSRSKEIVEQIFIEKTSTMTNIVKYFEFHHKKSKHSDFNLWEMWRWWWFLQEFNLCIIITREVWLFFLPSLIFILNKATKRMKN